MKPVKIVRQACGCEVGYEPIPRSLFVREYWHSFCQEHDILEKSFRATAKRDHDQQDRERALAKEFT